MTTDDHTCVRLLDDVFLRQVLATRDPDERSMLVRLNLAATGAVTHPGRLIGRGPAGPRGAGPTGPSAADRARHPSAGRHAAADPAAPTPDRRRSTAA